MYFKHLFTLSALVLAACSSDDSDGDSNNNTERSANATPTVTVNNGIGKEKETITITATASDSDGSISSYSWNQTAGVSASMVANGSSIELTLPEVLENQQLEFQLTVTDNDGANASTSFEVDVEAIFQTYTFTGEISTSRSSLPGTNVSLTVGSQSWVSNSNELGVYRFEVDVDDSNFGEMITLATSPDKNTINRLISLLPALETFDTSADAEGNITIDQSVSEGVNVSTLSTARYVLAAINDDEKFTTYEQYHSRSMDWKAKEAFEIVTLVDVIANEVLSENFSNSVLQSLPVDFSSLFEYIDSKEKAESLIYGVKAASNWAWENAIESIAASNKIQFTQDLATQKIITEQFGKLELNEDGTGLIKGSFDTAVNWQLLNGNIVLDILSEDFPTYVDNRYVSNYQLQSLTFTPIWQTSKGYYVNYQQNYLIDSSSSLEYEDGHTALTSVTNSVPLTTVLETNTKWYLSFVDINTDTFDVPTDNEQHRGSIRGNLREMEFDAMSQSDGTYDLKLKQLILNDQDLPEFETYNVQAAQVGGEILFSYSKYDVALVFMDLNDDGTYSFYADISEKNQPENSEWTSGNAVPYIETKALTEQDVSGKIFEYENDGTYSAWYEFNSDGSMAYIYAEDNEGDGVIDDLNTYTDVVLASIGIWRVEDGILKMLRHRSPNYTCLSDSWAPALEDECSAFLYREWQPIFDINSTDNNTGYVLDESTIYYDYLLDRSAFPEESPLIPYRYSNFLLKFSISDKRPIALPEDVYQQLTDD